MFRIYAKALIKVLMMSIKQKIETFNALRTAYGLNFLVKLPALCIMRKPVYVKINPINLNIRFANCETLLMLSRAFYKFVKLGKNQYSKYMVIVHDKLCLRIGNSEELECFNVKSLGENLREVLSLYSTILLIIYTNVLSVDKETLLIKTGDEIYWHIRRRSLDDVSAPLLPFISEPYEYHEWFEKIVKENTVFVDVGAFLGGYAIRAAKKGAKVLAFEPSKSNYQLLERNIQINNLGNKITAFKIAVGSAREKRPLYSDGLFYATLSLIPNTMVEEYIDVYPLDEMIASELNIDLLKIDVEGAEIEVLKGADEVLKRTKYVMVEVQPENKKEVYLLMKQHGFEVLDINIRGKILNILFHRAKNQ
jgi:FkbM family methyltransferase